MDSVGFAPNAAEVQSPGEWHEAGGAVPVAAAGRAVAATQADDRHLIALVRARPALYARNAMPAARAQVLQKRLWHEVANGMGWSVEEARRKWSHVRNSYSRHLRNEVLGSRTNNGRIVTRWYLADELAFLRDHMATDTRSSLSSYTPAPAAPTSVTIEEMDVKPFSLTNDSWTGSCGSEVSASSPAGSYNEPADDGAVYMEFFRGLFGEYSTLSPHRRRRFKRRCLSALHRLLDEQERTPAPGDGEAAVANSSSDDDTRTRAAQPLCVLTTVDSSQQLHSST